MYVVFLLELSLLMTSEASTEVLVLTGHRRPAQSPLNPASGLCPARTQPEPRPVPRPVLCTQLGPGTWPPPGSCSQHSGC